MKSSRTRLLFLTLCAILWCGSSVLRAQTLTAGSVSAIDANGNVTFSLTFDQPPDFLTADSIGRQAVAFQFFIGAGPVPPIDITRPLLSLVQGSDIHTSGTINIRNEAPPDPSPGSGGWGTVRARVNYVLNGRTLTFTAPASALNVTGPFVYTVQLTRYGGGTSSYTGTSGGPIQFTAPESIAHRVYRDKAIFFRTGVNPRGLHNIVSESTILFEDDTHFTYLVYRENDSPPDTDGKTRLLLPRADGTYRFTRTENNLAVLSLDFADGSGTGSYTLSFASAAAGTATTNGDPRPFSLGDLAAFDSVAARNVSMRGTTSPGKPLIVGFIAPGTREVLVRAVGPSLRPFGVTTAWADPDFQIYQGSTLYPASERPNPDWDTAPVASNSTNSGAALKKIFSYLGAFSLQDGSKDAANVFRLPAGSYTIVCSPPAGDPGGDVLVEVYFLP